MKHNVVMKNTAMLYILTLSNYVFNFITVPHLTRVLGPVTYGKVSVGMAFATYIQLFLDFGFVLSATADVAKAKGDTNKVSQIYTTVMYGKLFLTLCSLVIVLFLCNTVTYFEKDKMLFFLFWLYMAVNALLPDFLYRGIEKMQVITYRTLLMKIVFTVCIFLFIDCERQYLLVPIFYLLGSLTAVVFVLFDVKHNLKLVRADVKIIDVVNSLKKSGMFFLSRIAGTAFSAMNMLVLGAVFPGAQILGYYGVAEKLITAGRGVISPISDSLYPYMVKTQKYEFAKKIIVYGSAVVSIGCIVVGIFAEQICVLLFGAEYRDAANIVRIMLPLIVITVPSYIIAFPILTPLGMVKYANVSVIVGSVFQSVVVILMLWCDMFSVYSVCVLTCISETIVLVIRVGAMLYGFKRKNKQ